MSANGPRTERFKILSSYRSYGDKRLTIDLAPITTGMQHILNDLYSTIPVHLLTTRSDQNFLQKVPIMSLCAMFGDASTTSEYSNMSRFLSGYGKTSRSPIFRVATGFPSVELFHPAQTIFRKNTRSVIQSIGSI
jgi:hypothetical protein